MRTVLAAVLGFIIGLVVVYAAVVAGSLWYMTANRIPDRDGGTSMAIVFLLGPACALLGGTLASIVAAIRTARRQRAIAAGELPPSKPWPLPALIIGTLLAGAAVYFAAWAVLWISGPLSFHSYWTALAVSRAPLALALAAATLVAWRGWRNRARAKAP